MFTAEQTASVKRMFKVLIDHKEQTTKGGFLPKDLTPILDEMVIEQTILKRPTVHGVRYFINLKE